MKNLRSQIEQYQMENPVRFHIPAHKGRMTDNLFCGIAPYDITELDFSDNLNMPVDVLREEEKRAADVFGVKKTIFTVNGASAAVMAAILATVGENECLLVPSNSHVSCYYGAIHAGAKVVRCSVNDPIVGITLDEITNIINARSDIKTCVITSPTYCGCVADLRAICSFLKSKGIVVIADESHGTHFHFSDTYPISAVDTSADIVIHSGHKTINGLTQTAMVHINSGRVTEDSVRSALRLLQTTSPSYLLLLSLASAVDELKNCQDILNRLQLWYNEFEQTLATVSPWCLLNKEKTINGIAAGYDPMKLCLSCASTDGEILDQLLRKRYAIYAEMSMQNIVLFAAGLNSRKEDYDRLQCALSELHHGVDVYSLSPHSEQAPNVRMAMSIRQAYFAEKESVSLKDAVGRVSADFIYQYPPGSPLLIPGDYITAEIAEFIDCYTAQLTGIYGNTMKVVRT